MDRNLALKEIETVVVEFYKKAIYDVLIGYHFQRITDFSTHIPRIIDFWARQLLPELYLGNPASFKLIPKHQALGIKRGEVGRWVILFEKTLEENPLNAICAKKWKEKIQHFQKVFISTIPIT